MSLSSQTEPLFLRVTKKPTNKKNKFIFFAVEVDSERWSKIDNRTHYIIEICDDDVEAYSDELDIGAVCRVVPSTMMQKIILINNEKYNRRFVTATAFTLVRAKGSLIVKLLIGSNKFKGLGSRKVGRLWERFGTELYGILDSKQVDKLTEDFEGQLTTEAAIKLVDAWETYIHTDAILFCDRLKLTVSQSFRITRYYKNDTKQKIEEDPYRLLAFSVSFEQCDDIAINIFKMSLDDDKRLSAAVEESLYKVLESGSVVSDGLELRQIIEGFILKDDVKPLVLKNNYKFSNDEKLKNTIESALYKVLDGSGIVAENTVLHEKVTNFIFKKSLQSVISEANEKLVNQPNECISTVNTTFEQQATALQKSNLKSEKSTATKKDENNDVELLVSVESALYQVFESGSVKVGSDYDTLHQKIKILIIRDALVTLALKDGYKNSNYVLLENGNYQSNGSFLMETFIAKRIKTLLTTQLQIEIPDFRIKEIISEYEITNEFNLTNKQKLAVTSVMNNKFCVINGGAGVGKTTVLDCIYSVFKECGIVPVQVALAAKAAKRMSEATGKDSFTIARFVRRFKRKGIDFRKFVLVLDESSMVDLFSMYKLLSFLPEDSRIIILGDDGQLHPVGYGLILHELLKVPQIPTITLTEVKRQDKDSNIPHVSNEVRNGIVPSFGYEDIKFINANNKKKVLESVLSIYQEDVDNTQIICATRKMAESVNLLCADLNKSKKLLAFNEYYDAFENTGYRLSDKVMCTANLYAIDVMNASVGEIVECYKMTQEIDVEVDGKQLVIQSFGKIKWDDGLTTEITDELLDNLTHAYAMTIHKSQGSQFDTVIIPVFQAAYMDRTMLYTAITRAQKKVVLVGSDKLLVKSINMVHSDERKADLANKLLEILN
jgi:exodeoxyribonuclease V alpha subunit